MPTIGPSAVESLPGALLFERPQGTWRIEDWARLNWEHGGRIELVDGCLELPAMPSRRHLRIQRRIRELLAAVLADLASDLIAETLPWKLRISPRTGRVADVIVFREDETVSESDESGGVLGGGEVMLAVEVISPGRRQRDRDLHEKRDDYAAAGISEYWIVDPEAETVRQLRLVGGAYEETALLRADAGGHLVPHFGGEVDVAALFAD